MQMPDLKRRAAWLQVVIVAAYVYYCWASARAYADAVSTDADDDLKRATMYDKLSRVCYRIAAWFGSVGIEAEAKAHRILDEGRMN